MHSDVEAEFAAFRAGAFAVVFALLAGGVVSGWLNVTLQMEGSRVLSSLTFIESGRFSISMASLATLLERCSMLARTCVVPKSIVWPVSLLC